MICFAIRQKSTGYWFPQTGRGSTWAEFKASSPPRLFRKKPHADVCLKRWQAGAVRVYRTGGGVWDDYDEHRRITVIPERQNDDYEVLAVSVEVAAQ